ncbi:MAG: nucleotidyltransferase family protein [Candidatus Aureabacteria bacterium]|nr:nucleotidyltransferase family protein [Candidatus Auribacterota bacterium]
MLSSILLAAGESSRMGSPKALLAYGRSTFLETICRRLWESGVNEVIVVLGARADSVRKGVALEREKVVINGDFALGQLSSLRCGLRAIDRRSDGVLVTLVDHPVVSGSTYRTLRERWERAPDKIVVARYRGRGGHPVIFPRIVFEELMEAPLKDGARSVLRKDERRVVGVDLDDAGIVADVDVPEDYKKYVEEPGSDRGEE